MTLPLTPETLRAAYDLLNTTPPFSRWNLPDAEDVVFKVDRHPARAGWHMFDRKHAIGISRRCIGHTVSLLATMAHEMIHVHEKHTGASKAGVEHSGAFKKWAAQVCRIHGFDPKLF